MTREQKAARIAHAKTELRKYTAEIKRGFQDRVIDGRLIATAKEQESAAWEAVGHFRRQIETLSAR